jgi:hypothetical protein
MTATGVTGEVVTTCLWNEMLFVFTTDRGTGSRLHVVTEKAVTQLDLKNATGFESFWFNPNAVATPQGVYFGMNELDGSRGAVGRTDGKSVTLVKAKGGKHEHNGAAPTVAYRGGSVAIAVANVGSVVALLIHGDEAVMVPLPSVQNLRIWPVLVATTEAADFIQFPDSKGEFRLVRFKWPDKEPTEVALKGKPADFKGIERVLQARTPAGLMHYALELDNRRLWLIRPIKK